MNYSVAITNPSHSLGEIINPTEDEIELVTRQVNQAAITGTIGRTITILPNPKNLRLREDYSITDDRIIEIITSIEPCMFSKMAFSDNPNHPNDIVIVYIFSTYLQPSFKVEGEAINVSLYIKLTFPCPIEPTPMIVISFHEERINA